MNLYFLGTVLNMSTILMTAGAGSFLSVRGGNFNLGGEGQIYFGGFIAAVSLCACKNLPVVIAIPLCFFLACAASGLLSLIPALLKIFRKVDVLLTTFLLSAGTIPLVDSFVSGRFRGTTNNLNATEFIPLSFRFPSIMKPSALNGSIFAAVLLCLALYFILEYTAFGQNLTIHGISPVFTVYSGISSEKLTLVSVTLSGCLHGAAGFFCVVGMYYTCHSGFYAGMGWNAFSVSLISMKNPLYLIPSALILSFVTHGASQYSLMHNFGFDMGTMLQGVILFIIVLGPAVLRKIFGLFRRGK